MIELQPFKENDEREKKVTDAFDPALSELNDDRDDFFDGAFSAFPLGDVLYDLNRDPLVGVVTRDTFRQSFFSIHEFFTRPGTFEFYLTVFRAVWGESVAVEFIVPEPGKLLINIQALDIVEDLFLARRIEDNQYVFDEVIDHDGDNIVFQTTLGIKTQSETDALIHELAPAGIVVEAQLQLS